MEYKLKPLKVKATQWKAGDEFPGIQYDNDGEPCIEILTGTFALDDGDWILESPAGHIMVVTNDTFEFLFEKA